MGGSLKEVSTLKNCYILVDPKGRLNLYLYLGLPGLLMKHPCARTSIALGRVCKGDDLDDTFCSDLSPPLLKLPMAIGDPGPPSPVDPNQTNTQRHQHYHLKGISTNSLPGFRLQIVVISIQNHQFWPFLSSLEIAPSTESSFKQNKRY